MPSWQTLSVSEPGLADEIRQESRPHATPLLVVALGLWVGAAGSFLACLDLAFPASAALVGASLVGAALCSVVLIKGGPAWVCLVGIGFGLGCACGCAAGAVLHSQQDHTGTEGPAVRAFTVLEDVHYGEFNGSCIAETKLESGEKVAVRLVLRCDDQTLKCGDVITSPTTLQPPPENSRDYYWRQGLSGCAAVYSFERVNRGDALSVLFGLRNAGLSLFDGYESPGALLLRAIVFGERSGLSGTSLYSEVKVIGLAHLVAVSGTHLNIVVGLIALCLRAARIPRPLAGMVQIACILAYVACTGLALSAIRAACMATVSMGAYYARRRSSSLSSLGACIIGLLLADPATAVSVSFALSALSTLGIVALGRLFSSWSRLFRLTRIKPIREGLSLTMASSVLALPLSAAVFAQLSLIAPLSNILVGPAFALLCASGMAASVVTLLLPALGNVLIDPLVFSAGAFCEATGLLACIPFAAIPWNADAVASIGVGGAATLALWRIWPKPSRRNAAVSGFLACVLCIGLGLPGAMASDDRIVMLDVGQGDAFLLTSKGASILIDTGTADTLLLQALARHNVYSLDALVITHADDDHCGSLPALKGVVAVDKVCFAADVQDCGCEACGKLVQNAAHLVGTDNAVSLAKGDVLRVGDFEVEVLWPETFSDEGGNADSLVLLARLPKKEGRDVWRALFCGDAEAEQIKEVADSAGLDGIDLLKVGHHGSKAALTEELAGRLRPKAALVSVGRQNRYGHPAPETLRYLDDVYCEVFRSDEEGDVVCKLKPEKLRIEALG